MLPAAHRIRTAADFQQTTRRGRKLARAHAVVYVDTSSSEGAARLGVITNSSVGGSVARHRAARRIRAAVGGILDEVPPGTRIVVRALPGADRDPQLPQQVSEAITSALAMARNTP